jgi:hypothetical protein
LPKSRLRAAFSSVALPSKIRSVIQEEYFMIKVGIVGGTGYTGVELAAPAGAPSRM